jgi:hypothetical protein
MPEAVVHKMCNPYTSGIPDIAIIRNGKTLWIEVKLLTKDSKSKLFVPLQLQTCKRMLAHYIIWSPALKKGWLFRADDITDWIHFEQYTFAELVNEIARMA